MSSKVKSTLLKYGVTAVLCAAVAVSIFLSGNYDTSMVLERYRLLSDAFSLPGIMTIFAGLMVWLSNEGAMDAITWVMTYAFKSLFPGLRGERERYGDYVERRREKRVQGYGYLFVVGGLFLTVGLVFVILFEVAYRG